MPGLQSLSYAPGQNPKQNKKQTRNKQKETDNVKKQRRKKHRFVLSCSPTLELHGNFLWENFLSTFTNVRPLQINIFKE